MADEDILIKNLPTTESVNDDDDIVIEDASPTTYRIKAGDLRSYITSEVARQISELEETKADQTEVDEINQSLSDYAESVFLESSSDIYNELIKYPTYRTESLCTTGDATYFLTNGYGSQTARGYFVPIRSASCVDFTLCVSSTAQVFIGRLQTSGLVALYRISGTNQL